MSGGSKGCAMLRTEERDIYQFDPIRRLGSWRRIQRAWLLPVDNKDTNLTLIQSQFKQQQSKQTESIRE